MFKHSLTGSNKPSFTLHFLSMTYVTMVILSIILFDQILDFSLLGMHIQLSGSLIPYVFLFPISFITLRVYGLSEVNHMIAAEILVSLLFVVMATVVAHFSANTTDIHSILLSSSKMYMAGFIGMPAGIYASFLTIKWLGKMSIPFNTFSLCIATIVGEMINTVIVFPVGFHGQYSMHEIFSSIIVDAMLFKAIAGVLLAFLAMISIDFLIQKKVNQA